MPARQTIFIVDDNELIRDILQGIFHSAGFRVETYASAQLFLDGYTPCAESCLLLDLRLPEIGGLELLKRLRQQQIDLPIIIYTGYADVPVAVRAMQQGAFSVIEKPLNGELLIEEVRAAIRGARAPRSRRSKVNKARESLAQLTERERQVAKSLADGLSAAEAAAKLGIGMRTVETHRTNIFRKLEIKSSTVLTQLVLQAEQEGE